jgi:hypothetical protein
MSNISKAVGWNGYLRAEMQKAVISILKRSNTPSRKQCVDIDANKRSNNAFSIDYSNSNEHLFSNLVCLPHHFFFIISLMYYIYLQETSHLQDVIYSLDEKLRDLKKKCTDEMRRSLHIQSECIIKLPFLLENI